MPVETFSYLDSLNASNPVSTDGQAQGDDHIRGIKSVLKATFPNIAGATTVTHTQLNNLGTGNIQFADGTATAPSITFSSDTGAGFYKVTGTGQTTIGVSASVRLSGDGLCPVGMIADFLTISPPSGWYYANGQAVPRTGATALLFAAIGTQYGAGNGTTTFNLPNLSDRYRRSSFTWATGTFLSDAIKSHTVQSVIVNGGDHTHVAASSVNSLNLSVTPNRAFMGSGSGTVGDPYMNSSWQGVGTALPVTGTIGITTTNSNSGNLGMSGQGVYTGDSETRPLTFVVSTYIKS